MCDEPPIIPGGMQAEPPPFPSAPSAGGNAPFTIVVDTREQTPLTFPADVPTIRAGLRTGDYSIAGCEDAFTIERKSLADLVHTIIHDRARFERELDRMRPFDFRRVICTASMDAVRRGKYPHSLASPKAVVASIAAFEVRYNVPFVFAGSSDEAARRIVDWARYFTRERMLRDHERMLAEHSAGGSVGHPTPRCGSWEHPSNTRKPTAQGAEHEVIPPFHGTIIHKRTHPCGGNVARCMELPNNDKPKGKRRGGARKHKAKGD